MDIASIQAGRLSVEGLVHESIHAFLGAVQLRAPFIVNHAQLSSVSMESPWTGNVLPMDAFVEACFVWFGLFNFWASASRRLTHIPGKMEGLRKRALSGFKKMSLTAALDSARSTVTDEVVHAIGCMQEMLGSPGQYSSEA